MACKLLVARGPIVWRVRPKIEPTNGWKQSGHGFPKKRIVGP